MNQNQNPNKIQNPQSDSLPQVKGPQMNDRDRCNDILTTEKTMASHMNIAAWEASHQQFHQDLMTIVNETQDCHRDLFNVMFQKGWYKLDAENQNTLDQTYTQFSNYSSQFPYQASNVQ